MDGPDTRQREQFQREDLKIKMAKEELQHELKQMRMRPEEEWLHEVRREERVKIQLRMKKSR